MPVDEPKKGEEALKKIKERIDLRDKSRGRITEVDLKLLYDFADKLVEKFGGFIQGLVLFGSVAKGEQRKESDLDVLALVDDATWETSQDLISAWRFGVGKILVELGASKKIHVTTLGIVQFWDGVRHTEPVILNILRDGQPIIETGFFKPLKKLLEMGTIRPSKEAIQTRISNAGNFLVAHENKLLLSFGDLYWAAINAAHAVLMANDIIPTSPSEVAEMLRKKLKKKIKPSEAAFLNKLVKTLKQLSRKEKKSLSLNELKDFEAKTTKFVNRMLNLAKKKI